MLIGVTVIIVDPKKLGCYNDFHAHWAVLGQHPNTTPKSVPVLNVMNISTGSLSSP